MMENHVSGGARSCNGGRQGVAKGDIGGTR